MKIIHVVLGKANPERMNGVNKVAYQLAKTQHEIGHEVTVWGLANSLAHNYPPRSFRTELFPQSSNKLRLDPKLVKAVGKLEEGTVLHMHGAFIPEFFQLAKLLKQRGLEYVYTPHGSLTKAAMQQSKWRKKFYFYLFERYVIEHAKAVQMLGEQEYSFIDTLMDVPQKVLIPNGMDLNEIPVLPKRISHPIPVFNFCGRIDIHHKGLDLMMRGFHCYLENGHSARLELIGDGKDRKALEQLTAKLGIAEHVVFHGAKYGEEKYLLMAQGDIFLHTSRNEGFPMAVLEAAALGLPCLTSEPTNINRFIREYGAGFPLTDGHSPKQICNAMEKGALAFHAGKLRAMGRQAKLMVREAFDWPEICGRLVEVYATSPAMRSASS